MTATLLALGLALLLLEIATHRRLARALRPPPAPPRLHVYPSLTVIRPVKGLDPEVAENLRAALDTGYPGSVQTIFVFDDEREPAVPLAEAAIEERAHGAGASTAEVLFCGPPPPGRTGKLNAMIQGLGKARGELIAFADSDIRTDRQALRILVETLRASPRAGSVFAPVVVSEPARTLGDAVYAILLNGLYSPPAAAQAGRRERELPFILGQFMVISRQAIEAIGGLERVQGQLVDDLYIGQLVRAAGLRNVVSGHPIRIIQYGLGPREALQVVKRWFAFSRTGIPEWGFKLPIAQRAASCWLGVLGACGFAVAGHGLLAAASALLAAWVTVSVGSLHGRVGGAPLRGLHRLAPALVYLVAPILLLRTNRMRCVRWRGRAYALDAGGRLAEAPRGVSLT